MKNLKLAIALLVVPVLAAGCGSGGTALTAPTGTQIVSAGNEISAFTAAGADYKIFADAEVQVGKYVTTPILGDWLGFFYDSDETSFGLNLNGTFYKEPVQGTGWKSFDEFDIRKEGYTAAISYYNLATGDLKGWSVGGGYMYPVGQFNLKASVDLGSLDDGGSDSLGLFAPSISCDYYIQDNLSVGLSWDYEHYSDDPGSFSQNLFRFNVGYKINMGNPLLVKFTYGQVEINESDTSIRNVILGVDWALQDKWLVGVSVDRFIDDDTWGNWIQTTNLTVGYRLNSTSNVSLGGAFLSESGGGDSYNGVNIGYTMTF